MHIKGLVDENFQDYKVASMFIATSTCTWKCCTEAHKQICQNLPLAGSPIIEVKDCEIVRRYLSNSLTSAIVIGGLEPFDQGNELLALVGEFRRYTTDDIVIYTGYTEEEVENWINKLRVYPNIIVKFGRFIPDQESHYDEVLGVKLASPNQYARRLVCEQE